MNVQNNNQRWERLEPDVWRFRDSCTVYAVRGPEGLVLVNTGTGQAVDYLAELETSGPVFCLLTHCFRDHTDGAIRLNAAGGTILANYWEREYYLDPEQHFRARQVWNSYDNRWDRFAPVRPLPVSDWLRDYETRTIAGLTWEVVPTPAHTVGASCYVVTLNGRRLAFTGELIVGPGQTSRVAPLQYNYNDLDGAANLWHSCNRLREAAPDTLYPSLGEPMHHPAESLAALQSNLQRIEEIIPGFANNLVDRAAPDYNDIEEVLPHLWRSKHAEAETHFLVSDTGRVLSLDYGYETTLKMPQSYDFGTRRSLLHGIKGLKKQFGVDRIDTVLVTHYHDDHINGLPLLQRLFGTEVWAARHFSDLLERPEQYDRPCLWPEPIAVTRHLPLAETFFWENVPITIYPMSGHTRFSTLVCFEVDGVRVAHTGDQLFFSPWEIPDGVFPSDRKLFTNHVYKNGLDLGCYRETSNYLKQFQPEWILTGHTKPYRTTPEWYDVVSRGAEAFDAVHRALMPLGDEDIHFGPESQPAKLKPYHAHQTDSGPIAFGGWVLNPFPTPETAVLSLVAPEGWTSASLTLSLEPREQKPFTLTLTPPEGTVCRRQPVALDLTMGGRPFGQVTEAIVTLGQPYF